MTTREDPAATEDPKDPAATENPKDPAATEDPEGAGDPENVEIKDPKKVLELNEKYRSENKGLRDRLKTFEEEAESKRLEALTVNERAVEEARNEAKSEAEAGFRKTILQERVLARSVGIAIDPEDIFRLLDTDDLDADDGEAITAAIDALLTAKPHLRKSERRGINQGHQGGAPAGQSGNDWLRGTLGRG